MNKPLYCKKTEGFFSCLRVRHKRTNRFCLKSVCWWKWTSGDLLAFPWPQTDHWMFNGVIYSIYLPPSSIIKWRASSRLDSLSQFQFSWTSGWERGFNYCNIPFIASHFFPFRSKKKGKEEVKNNNNNNNKETISQLQLTFNSSHFRSCLIFIW